jgi:hypothetical protein
MLQRIWILQVIQEESWWSLLRCYEKIIEFVCLGDLVTEKKLNLMEAWQIEIMKEKTAQGLLTSDADQKVLKLGTRVIWLLHVQRPRERSTSRYYFWRCLKKILLCRMMDWTSSTRLCFVYFRMVQFFKGWYNFSSPW